MSDNNPMSQMWGNNQLDDAMAFFNFNNSSNNSNNGTNGNNNELLSNDISMPIISDSNNSQVPFNSNDQLNMNLNFGADQAQNSTQNLVQNAVPNQSQNNQKQQQQLFQQLQQQKQQQQQFTTLQSRKTSHSSQHSHSQVRSQVGTPKLQHDTIQHQNLNLMQNPTNVVHSPAMSNQSTPSTQPQQQQQQQTQRKVPANTQLNQQNTERFLDLVEQYMKKINKPFNRYPVIGGIKINLFVYYYVVTCIGGFIKAFQDQKFPLVANQLGIPVTNQKLYNDFLQTYYLNLLPFEQYARTADGMKDAQRRQNLAQQQQQQQQAQKLPVQSQQQTSSQMSSQLQDQLRQHQLQQQQLQQQQLQLQQQQLQLQQKMQQKMQQKIQQVQKKASEKQAQALKSQSSMISQPETQVKVPNNPQIPIQAQDKTQTQIIENAAKIRALSNISPHTTSVPIPLPNSKLHNKTTDPKKSNSNAMYNFRTPDIIKNYLPYTIIQDKPGGVDILNIERLGEQLDDMKPVFLYFPELGKVDIKALALSISSGITAEINVALNVLLIISSDPNIQIPFDKCMILLESLSLLGKTIVEKLASFDSDLVKTETNINENTKENIDMKPKSRIDRVFEKYSKLYGDKDYTIQVDSFTSQIVFDNTPNENKSIPDVVTIEGEIYDSVPTNTMEYESTKPNVFEECSSLISVPIENFNIPSYLNMLHECRSQADDIDSNIYAKCYLDKKLVLLEELSTISLIFRNLSFSGNNNTILATSNKYLDFIFTLIHAAIAKPEIFIYARKRLSFMKDSITILSNIIHAVDIRSDMEMWLIISLAFSFSTSTNDYEKELGLITSKVDPVMDKYHAHAVDVLSKSMYGSLSNKNRFCMVLTGKTLDTKVLNMVKINFGSECFENGSFIKSVYSLFISVLPINMMYQGIECFNELFQTCLESLLSCLSLTDILESSANIKANVALDVLTSPERFGMILQHLSFVYAAIYVNVKDNSSTIHALLSARCAELSNKLINCAINYAVLNETVDKDILKLRSVSRILGNTDNLIGMLMTTKMPAEISEQVIESLSIYNKLERLIK